MLLFSIDDLSGIREVNLIQIYHFASDWSSEPTPPIYRSSSDGHFSCRSSAPLGHGFFPPPHLPLPVTTAEKTMEEKNDGDGEAVNWVVQVREVYESVPSRFGAHHSSADDGLCNAPCPRFKLNELQSTPDGCLMYWQLCQTDRRTERERERQALVILILHCLRFHSCLSLLSRSSISTVQTVVE